MASVVELTWARNPKAKKQQDNQVPHARIPAATATMNDPRNTPARSPCPQENCGQPGTSNRKPAGESNGRRSPAQSRLPDASWLEGPVICPPMAVIGRQLARAGGVDGSLRPPVAPPGGSGPIASAPTRG